MMSEHDEGPQDDLGMHGPTDPRLLESGRLDLPWGERGPQGDTGQKGIQGDKGTCADLPSRLGLWIVLAVIALTAALFLLPYAMAINIRATQLTACEAAKVDRGLQADSWEAAYKVRKATATDRAATPLQRRDAREAAVVYRETFTRLRARSGPGYVCGEVYPKPPVWPG